MRDLISTGYGADASFETSQGTTAIDVAEEYEFDDTVEILEAATHRQGQRCLFKLFDDLVRKGGTKASAAPGAKAWA